MSGISKAIKELEGQKSRIETAIRVLRSFHSGSAGTRTGGSRKISSEGRQRIIEGQKKRWAKVRAAKKTGMRKKTPREKTRSQESVTANSE
ncbi:MAG TPA: hypothetical protein VMV31_03765 [Terriglobales bacterium]|nr:hypothetical protein [Terriglobales bacterium]